MEQQKHGEATLMLSALQERDSGLYQCCVQRNDGKIGLGEGTVLRFKWMNQSQTRDCMLCLDLGPLYYRAIISLLLTVLLSLAIILSLLPPRAERECSMNSTGDRSTEIIMYRAGVALGAMAFLAMTVLLLQRCKETTTKTQQQPAKRHRQAGGETSDVLHYAEINLTPGKPVEYASVQTHPGECTEYASVQICPL
ncbi:hypothetical protein Y1Q_0024448 [Alligator mississippiensis]|uniref:Uncharacterized protein n=1 Tax=Alligator mississippiensis TaxID=8496 RepID=A0A151N7A7_ALLMI|nr:hypothetical protein Y1Q_0024448 [Alligator mississippiensis]